MLYIILGSVCLFFGYVIGLVVGYGLGMGDKEYFDCVPDNVVPIKRYKNDIEEARQRRNEREQSGDW